MKILLISIITSMLSLTIHTQDYIPFPTTATWNAYKFEYYGPDDFVEQQYYYGSNYLIDSDTLINDTLYSKLFVRKSWYSFSQTGPNPSSLDTNYSQEDHPYEFIGGIREDDTKKVWYRNVNYTNWENVDPPYPWYYDKFHNDNFPSFFQNSTEVMLYDFGIEIGDSILFNDALCGPLWEVLDTIVVDDLLDRKKYIFYNNDFISGDITWIEGIGDIRSDPFSRFDVSQCHGLGFDIGKGLGCFWENGIQIYTDDEFDYPSNCEGAIFIGIEELEKHPLDIYPNPSTGEFIIRLPQNSIRGLIIYDVTGKTVISKIGVGNTFFVLDMSEYDEGVYFISIHTISGSNYVARFIKQ